MTFGIRDAPELCPLDARRLPREMYVKLFVVHFTVIGSYAHLRYTRGEPHARWPYVLMIGCPLAGTALVTVPAIALCIQAIICSGDRVALRQSANMLLGRRPNDHPEAVGLEPRLAVSFPNPSERLRALFMSVLLLSQCMTSIWLFSRRAYRESDTLYDHRILQLAILGLSVSIMSAIQVLLQPLHPSRTDYEKLPEKVRWLWFLRPVWNLGSDEPKNPDIDPALIDWTYAVIILTLLRVLGLKLGAISQLFEHMLHISKPWVPMAFVVGLIIRRLWDYIRQRP